MLLTPLIHRWNTTRDDDEIALPALIECLVFVISAVGPRIQPCAPQIYTRLDFPQVLLQVLQAASWFTVLWLWFV